MLYLSRLDMERIAQRVLRAYRKLPEAQERPACVDPELLARKVLGMTVRYRHLSEDGELLGMTSYGELEVFLPDEREYGACILDGKTILIEEELLFSACGPGRHNFTLCHECAHQILKMLYPASYGDGTAARRARCCRRHRLCARGSGHDWEEWQMDVLASELLIPCGHSEGHPASEPGLEKGRLRPVSGAVPDDGRLEAGAGISAGASWAPGAESDGRPKFAD